MEALGGIHRDKLLPRFAGRTFDAWFAARAGGEETPDGENPVVLFATCFVNYNNPALGEAAFEVLRHNGCRIACPNVECRGMPALDSGDIGLARRKARTNVRALLPWVERGYRIAVINPTCSLMMREEYPELLDDPADRPLAEAAQTVAGAVRDLSEYLFELRAEGKLKEDFKSTPGGNVACHAPCHLRKQNVGFRGRNLIRRIPGARPKLVAEGCGHDGTWAMKKENFAAAMQNGEKAFAGMREAEAEVWSTNCPLAALNFETRDTMLYQVHEMLHAEGSWERPGAIEDELAAYNPIVPAGGELSATLMLEYETEAERTVRLQELLGLDAHLWLHVGETPPVAARFDCAQASPTRVSSVQYVKWPLSTEQARMVAAEGTVLRVVIDHPRLRAQAVLSEETRRELAADLA